MATDTIPLTLLSRKLGELIDGDPPAYRHLYNLVLDGKIPAERQERGWQVASAAIPEIARRLGLTVRHAA